MPERRINAFITLQLPEIQAARDARGRFTSAQTNMAARNAAFAERLQSEVVRKIEGTITRPGASTGRLLRVTASPGNRRSDAFSAGVGVVAFLNSSVAKYWRTFEQGSAGLWKHPFVGTQLMPAGHNPPFPVAHGQTPGIRTMRKGAKRLSWMDGKRFVVKHEIAPRWAYRDALQEANPRSFAVASARKYLDEVLGRGLGFGVE